MKPDETAVEKDFVSPSPGSFRGLFFSCLILSLPLAPEAGHRDMRTAEETGL